jgi:hypothetical protein
MSTAGARLFSIGLAVVGLWPASARAQAADDVGATRRPSRVEVDASRGTYLPLAHGASIAAEGGFASAGGGYDGARSTGLFEATAEVHLWGPLALRGGALYSGDSGRMRPSFGVRVQALREGPQGVDGVVGVFYRPEGLTEPEGEIEAVISAGRHVGRTYVLGNLVYGQDPEGHERDGEVRLAALRPVGSSLLVGFDGRLRLDLGSTNPGRTEPTLDALAGPVVTVPLRAVALFAEGGGSMVQLAGSKATGLFGLAGLGGSF